jgi:hypothetical protein
METNWPKNTVAANINFFYKINYGVKKLCGQSKIKSDYHRITASMNAGIKEPVPAGDSTKLSNFVAPFTEFALRGAEGVIETCLPACQYCSFSSPTSLAACPKKRTAAAKRRKKGHPNNVSIDAEHKKNVVCPNGASKTGTVPGPIGGCPRLLRGEATTGTKNLKRRLLRRWPPMGASNP